ncbi:Eukaryotic translation initiation factor 4 gamma [Balamuthia mandrillaris]
MSGGAYRSSNPLARAQQGLPTGKTPPHTPLSTSLPSHIEQYDPASPTVDGYDSGGSYSSSTDEEGQHELFLVGVRTALSKLTPQTLESVIGEILLHVDQKCFHPPTGEPCEGLNSFFALEDLGLLLFETTLADPAMSPLYAYICACLTQCLDPVDDWDLASVVWERCQQELEEIEALRKDEGPPRGDSSPQFDERMRQRNLTTFRFIGELYNNQLLSFHEVLRLLSDALREPGDDHAMEQCFVLLDTAGKALESDLAEASTENDVSRATNAATSYQFFQSVFHFLQAYIDTPGSSQRIRTLFQYLLGLRQRAWKRNASSSSTSPAATAGTRVQNNEGQTNRGGESSSASSNPTPTTAGGGAGSGGGGTIDAEKMKQIRETARLIIEPMKMHLEFGQSLEAKLKQTEDNFRSTDLNAADKLEQDRMLAETRRSMNETWWNKLNELLSYLQNHLGPVPFLIKLIRLVSAYWKQTNASGDSKQSTTYETVNLRLLRKTIGQHLKEVEDAVQMHSVTTSTSPPPPSASSSVVTKPSTSSNAPSTGRPASSSPLNQPINLSQPSSSSSSPFPSSLSTKSASLQSARFQEAARSQNALAFAQNWETQLRNAANDFSSFARLLSKYDGQLLTNEQKLNILRKQTLAVDVYQTELLKELQLVSSQQTQLDTLLHDLADHVADTFQDSDEIQLHDSDEVARNLHSGLVETATDLKALVQQVNQLSQQRLVTTKDPIVLEFEEILNNNLAALEWVDRTSADITRMMNELQVKNG